MDSWIHLLTKKSQHKVFRVCLQIRQRAFISYYINTHKNVRNPLKIKFNDDTSRTVFSWYVLTSDTVRLSLVVQAIGREACNSSVNTRVSLMTLGIPWCRASTQMIFLSSITGLIKICELSYS